LAVLPLEFAAILTQRRDAWIATTRANALPGFDSYLNSPDNGRSSTCRLWPLSDT